MADSDRVVCCFFVVYCRLKYIYLFLLAVYSSAFFFVFVNGRLVLCARYVFFMCKCTCGWLLCCGEGAASLRCLEVKVCANFFFCSLCCFSKMVADLDFAGLSGVAKLFSLLVTC